MYDENGNYIGEEGGEDGSALLRVDPPEVFGPNQSDPRHIYVGRDYRGDVWQIVDSGGNVMEWATSPGDPSGYAITGSVRNLGPASSMTTAQPPATVATPTGDKIPDDASHRYVGTDANGDMYELTDAGGRIMRWYVRINDDSRNMIPGSASVVNPAGSNVGAVKPPTPTITPAGDGGAVAIVKSQNNPGAGDKIPDDPTHTYVGTDGGGDYYRLTDAGGNWITWQVKVNDDSRNVIAGTVKNLGYAGAPAAVRAVPNQPGAVVPSVTAAPTGVPGSMAINQPVNGGTTTTGAGGFSVVTVIGIAASLLGAFK